MIGLPFRIAICALLAVSACGLIASTARAADFTWSGGALPASHKWSDRENWVGDVAPTPSSTIATLSFPASRSGLTVNDLTGLSVGHLIYEGKERIGIGGQGLTLGSGGLTLDTPANGYNPLHISGPVALGGDQTWRSRSPEGTPSSEWGSAGLEPVLEVSGSITGGASGLTIDLESERALVIGEFGEGPSANDELGDTTINGTESVDPLNGARTKTRVQLGGVDFNGVDGHRLTVDDVELQDGASTGPITAVNSTVAVLGGGSGAVTSVSSGVEPEGIAYLPSATLDAGSSVNFRVEASGATPPVQTNELKSTGTIALGDSTLSLVDTHNQKGLCPPAGSLTTSTLISAQTLTGEFSNAPNGDAILVPCLAATTTSYQYHINYNTSSTPQTVTATPVQGPSTGGGRNAGTTLSSGASAGSAPTEGPFASGAHLDIPEAQLIARLRHDLVPSDRSAKIAALLARGSLLQPVTALEAGSVAMSWYDLRGATRLAGKVKSNPLLVASGRLAFAGAGSGKLRLVLTPLGRILLEHRKALRLTAMGTFTPPGKPGTTTSRSFTPKR